MAKKCFRVKLTQKKLRASCLWLILLPLFALGCDQIDQIQNNFRELTPHEAYFESLSAAGLAETALGSEWATVAATALSESPVVGLPFDEEGFLFAETPEARSYRVSLRRGQRLSIDIALDDNEPARLFVDVYRLQADTSLSPLPVLSSESTSKDLEYVSTRRADYVVRLQPELLRGGHYRISLRAEASMAFPVQGRSTTAILSVFGDTRDGGRRQHRGVDIFAPRGTPVLSATKGRVSRIETTPIGGKVVWVRDSEHSQSIYYAHLDSQVVRAGSIVERGTLIGMVGNTGNARTTPPHLHFSVYQRRQGAVDPYYFVYQPPGTLPDFSAPVDQLGAWTRTVNEGIRLRSGPSGRSAVISELEEHTPLRVLAATGSWYRVRLPNGRNGFVAARLTESGNLPIRNHVVTNASDLVSDPSLTAPVMESVKAGTGVSVLGTFDGFLYVQSPRGYTGWMPGDPGFK